MIRLASLLLTGIILLSMAVPAHAAKTAADAYFGYSRTGANLYGPNTPAMNGWQLAIHVKPMPFVGIEGDVSRYGANAGAGSQDLGLVMLGPRATVHAAGLSLFAHALGGFGEFGTNVVRSFPSTNTFASYAFGGGGDLPLLLRFNLRVTGDYLGDTFSRPFKYSPEHYRIGAGVALHF